ncbi:uncharacterized protein [Rutidosis leptorrhynchoides]|uniref:uncharacterized protein n=1 Tax=Rutidosis leptorrhynchoides TaxID=125765 RepID=UPI003A98F30F
MAQEEHTSRCSNSSSGGPGGGGVGGSNGGGGSSNHRSSKKLKHKKVPQRGMGVAQLEKIISEEQQKKDVNVLTPNLFTTSSNSGSNMATTPKVPNFRQQPSVSSCSIPLPPPLPPNHQPLVSNKSDNSGSVLKPANSTSGGGNWCRLWNDSDYSFNGEKHNQNQNQNQNQNYRLDHSRYTGATLSPNLGGVPYESSAPIWPPAPNLMLQRPQLFQQPISSPMVNVSAATSSSSVANFQIEPPSNQNHSGSNFQPLWLEEEKVVGMKRPYPFSLENVPVPPFHCKFPPISRSDELASFSNGGTSTTIEPAYPVFRDTSSSSVVRPDTTKKSFVNENEVLTRDFLKLAPPQALQLNSSSKETLHLSSCITEQTHYEILPPHNGQSKDSTRLTGIGGSNPQSFLSFFPAAKTPMVQPGTSNGEAGESVDLNLKL